ncbi:NUDIX domain-containing protein [Kineococcus sp. LSe6-4]|uniref:NUDIX domain-containing protein n=1 Tax=Kineococcus halophytocola TaxID=3234027 RepID=A0ABV4H4G6_9ACTN
MSPRDSSPHGGTDGGADVEAAGCVVVRPGPQGPEVLLVHRPATATRPADWSWPKGKLEDGEHPAVAAVRESAEETGLRVHLGVPLPAQRYRVPGPVPGGLRKRVRYWLARPAGPAEEGDVEPADAGEITEVGWFGREAARGLLTYPADVDVLEAALPTDELPPPTWPLVVLRHARAVKRADWPGGADGEPSRPLLDRGHAQARDLAPLLACFDLRALLTSPWARCVQTVLPAAELTGLAVQEDPALTEHAFRADPDAAAAVVTGLLDAARPVAVCSHGPVLPHLQQVVAARAGGRVGRTVTAKLDKAALLVAHVSGGGASARVIAAERHKV